MRPRSPEEIEARFWNKVQITQDGNSCWEWTGSRVAQGYGRFSLRRGLTVRAHRFAWEVTKGSIPAGLMVCHHCDNPPCVRPDHLFLGTNSDNQLDSWKKGRAADNLTLTDFDIAAAMREHPDRLPRGEKHGRAKLTNDAVAAIRLRYQAGGISQTALAEEYGVSQVQIGNVIRGKNWVT